MNRGAAAASMTLLGLPLAGGDESYADELKSLSQRSAPRMRG